MYKLLLLVLSASAWAQTSQESVPVTGSVAAAAAGIQSPGPRALPYWGPQDQSSGRTLYRWSLVSMIGANAADIATSWNAQEGNPALRVGQGQFGTASVALKSGFVAGSLLIQHVVLRHRPDLQRRMAWLNFAASGGLGAVAVHNSRIN